MQVAVAGSTGKLGQFITQHLLSKGLKVKLLTRPESAGKLEEFKGKEGVEIVSVDMGNIEAMAQTLIGVHTVISAVNGGPDISLDGQLKLLQASIKANVSRFSPSDYSADFRSLQPGEHAFLEFRRQVAEALKKEEEEGKIKGLHFLNGMFTDIAYMPFLGNLDAEKGTFSFWGNGDEVMDATTYEDTARYVATITADPSNAGWFEIIGQETTYNNIANVYEELTGKTLQRISHGSLQDLHTKIEELKAIHGPQNPFPYVFLQYAILMISGRGKLHKPCNKNFPEIKPQGFKEFFTGKI